MSSADLTELSSKISKCLQNIYGLQETYAVQSQFAAQFKSFLLCLSECLGGIKSLASLPGSRPYRRRVLLCVSQVCKALKLFPCLLRQPPCKQSVWYLSERLAWCLTELSRVLCGSPTEGDEDSDGSDSFLSQVERARTLLLSPPFTSSWKQLLDDLVCQAVTVAKMATDTDYNEITSACHLLLEESSQLIEGDVSQFTLLIDSLTVSLIRLERRVNNAILRLMLQVFSEPNKPVKELVRKCARGEGGSARDAADLEPLIAQLDAHVERICLVAQFAINCCQDTVRSRGMQCCLASLESVDNCLVPALTALYLRPESGEHQQFVHFLCEHWRDQLSCLHTHLDAILDSYAFSQIVSESMSNLFKELRPGGEALHPAQLIVKQGWLLYKHLSRSSDHTPDNQLLTRLKQGVYECETAVCQQAPLAAVVKRVELLSAVVDDICDQLGETDTNSSSLCSSDWSIDGEVMTSHLKLQNSPARTVNSIRDLPLDISLTSNSESQYNSYRPNWLQQKICEAKENLKKPDLNLTDITTKECSISAHKSISLSAEIKKSEKDSSVDNNVSTNKSAFLSAQTPKKESNHSTNNVFETPKNNTKNATDLLTPYLSQKCERSRTLYVRTPRQLVQCRVLEDSLASEAASANLESCDSLALEITDILKNLSSLADTLSSTGEANCTQAQASSATDPVAGDTKQGVCCGAGHRDNTGSGLSLVSVRTEEISDVNTPQRLQDLRDLDERILNLKLM